MHSSLETPNFYLLTWSCCYTPCSLMHTMHNAFHESPFPCLTHLCSSLVNHLGLNAHFPGFFFFSKLSHWQHNFNILKNSSITSFMWHVQEDHKSYNLQSIWFWLRVWLTLLVGYFCNKDTLICTKNFSSTPTDFIFEKKIKDFSRT